ncbi:MAG: AAA family ATPase [Hydrogeniiclostridium mannosilyticum]
MENVAVIEKAEIHFVPGLNVLTGETGAGKSILLDSINAVMGNNVPDLIRTGARSSFVCAAFSGLNTRVLKRSWRRWS